MIKEHGLVRTLVDKEGFPAGTKGVVVSIYSSSPACEVEAWDENNYPVDVITYKLNELAVVIEVNKEAGAIEKGILGLLFGDGEDRKRNGIYRR